MFWSEIVFHFFSLLLLIIKSNLYYAHINNFMSYGTRRTILDFSCSLIKYFDFALFPYAAFQFLIALHGHTTRYQIILRYLTATTVEISFH